MASTCAHTAAGALTRELACDHARRSGFRVLGRQHFHMVGGGGMVRAPLGLLAPAPSAGARMPACVCVCHQRLAVERPLPLPRPSHLQLIRDGRNAGLEGLCKLLCRVYSLRTIQLRRGWSTWPAAHSMAASWHRLGGDNWHRRLYANPAKLCRPGGNAYAGRSRCMQLLQYHIVQLPCCCHVWPRAHQSPPSC